MLFVKEINGKLRELRFSPLIQESLIVALFWRIILIQNYEDEARI